MNQAEATYYRAALSECLERFSVLSSTELTSQRVAEEQRLSERLRELCATIDRQLKLDYGPLHEQISTILDKRDLLNLVAFTPPEEYWDAARDILLKLIAGQASSIEDVAKICGDAIAREKEIKGWVRKRKVALVEEENPEWRDLSEGWCE